MQRTASALGRRYGKGDIFKREEDRTLSPFVDKVAEVVNWLGESPLQIGIW